MHLVVLQHLQELGRLDPRTVVERERDDLAWLLGPLVTNGAPLATQPTSCGVWSLATAARRGNSDRQMPVAVFVGPPDLDCAPDFVVPPGCDPPPAAQPRAIKVLLTCQRVGRKPIPMLAGVNVAVMLLELERFTVAAMKCGLPLAGTTSRRAVRPRGLGPATQT